MIKSMTSYGRASQEFGQREYLVEIKTVNHKYNDITIRMSKNLSYLEDNIRKLVLNYVSRGKLDVYIEVNDYSEDGNKIRLNRELIKSYVRELKEIAEENYIINDISIMNIMKLPDTLRVKADNEIIEQELMQVLSQALENLMEMRTIEGCKIEQDIQKRIESIEKEIIVIEEKSHGLIDKYREKLREKIAEICNENIDESRLAQEVVIYADKTSIQEELTRIKSHCNQFRITLSSNENSGKKLDFILQEMNREINTIGSKANCLDITNCVIKVKTEIEDIREQVQNIE